MLTGPALAPMIGGAVSRYLSWRWMQIILGSAGFTAYLLVYFFLTETMHPGLAGYEKRAKSEDTMPSKKFVFLNPVKSVMLLLSPVLLISVRGSFSCERSGQLMANDSQRLPLLCSSPTRTCSYQCRMSS